MLTWLRAFAERQRLTAIAIAVALCVCFVVAGALIGVHRSWLDEKANDKAHAGRLVVAMSTSIERGLSAIERALSDVAGAFGPMLETDSVQAWVGIQDRLRLAARANPDILRIGLSDSAGVVRATSTPESHPLGISVATQEFFTIHHDKRVAGLWVTRPFASPFGGEPIIAVSRAIRDAAGGLLGVVTAAIPSSRFITEWNAPGMKAIRPGLLRLDGVVLHGAPQMPRSDANAQSLAALFGPGRVSGNGVRDLELSGGRDGFFAWRLVPDSPLVVVATAAIDDLWWDWVRARQGEFLGGTLIALLSAGLGVALFRAIRRALAAEQRLRETTERRFRDAIEQMPDGVLMFDADDRLIAWNRRYIEVQPFAASVLRVGLPARDLVAHVFACIQATGGEGPSVEARLATRADQRGAEFATADGRLVSATDRRLSDGGLITILRDVTEERHLLERLATSEARFRDFASTASDWFWETDAEGRYTYMSHGLRRLGIDPDELIGKPRRAFSDRIGQVYPEDRDRVGQVFDSREAFRDLRYRIIGADGLEREFEIVGKPLFDATGTFIGHRGGGREVTAVRVAERKLAENERRARDFAEASSDWMWETGLDGRFTFMSDGVRRFGLAPEQFVGRSRGELPYDVPADAPGLVAAMAATEARQPFRDVVFPGRLADGRVLQISLTGWPRLGEDGVFLGFRGVGRDVAASMHQQEALERALIAEREMNQQQRRFIAVASHEFRTPLAVIDGAAQRIRARLATVADGEILKRIDRIRSAVARMTQIIDSTLSTARLDEGRITLHPRNFDLVALIHEVCDRQRSISADYTIHCLAPPVIGIEGDPRLLDQVFTNLLSNAVKYSGRARRIDVKVTATPNEVAVIVKDYGIGMTAADREHLFQRFFRAETAQGIAGTGIGLHLVKELVRLHGGAVEVDSEIGRGSVFTVRLHPRLPQSVAAIGAAA